MSAAEPNLYEAAAREKKALALADSLIRQAHVWLNDAESLHALAAVAHELTPERRRLHERAAGVALSSDVTWGRVAEILCERARAAQVER